MKIQAAKSFIYTSLHNFVQMFGLTGFQLSQDGPDNVKIFENDFSHCSFSSIVSLFLLLPLLFFQVSPCFPSS